MEFIIEGIFEFIIEICFDVSSEKKFSRWIRYPLIIILILIFAAITGLFVYAGMDSLDDRPLMSVICFAVALFIVIGTFIKFRKVYGKNK